MALRPQQSTIGPMTLGRVLQQGDLGAQRVNNVQNQLLKREAAQQEIDLNQQLNPLLVTAKQQANQANQGALQDAEQQRVMNSMFAGWKSIKPYLSNANPSADDVESMQSILRNRFQEIEARGGDASDTWEMMTAIETGDFEKARNLGAGLEAVVMGSSGGKTAATRDFEARARAAGLEPGSPEYVEAARIDIGLDPRASISARERIAQRPNLAQQVAESEAMEAGAKEAAKQAAKLKLEPQVAAAVEKAVSNVKADAKVAEENRGNERALDVYNTAMENLVTALGGTMTGPGAGLVPAMTANAQIAEGAMATMAPVLKSIFRVSGEGTFTDKDQELLLNMVPTRSDLPEARAAKVAAIDSIVKAKLGTRQKTQDSQNGTPVFNINGNQYRAGDTLNFNGQTIRILGGDPADPDIEVLQ